MNILCLIIKLLKIIEISTFQYFCISTISMFLHSFLDDYFRYLKNDAKRFSRKDRVKIFSMTILFPILCIPLYDIFDEIFLKEKRELKAIEMTDARQDKVQSRMKRVYVPKESLLRQHNETTMKSKYLDKFEDSKKSIAENYESIELLQQKLNNLHVQLIQQNKNLRNRND